MGGHARRWLVPMKSSQDWSCDRALFLSRDVGRDSAYDAIVGADPPLGSSVRGRRRGWRWRGASHHSTQLLEGSEVQPHLDSHILQGEPKVRTKLRLGRQDAPALQAPVCICRVSTNEGAQRGAFFSLADQPCDVDVVESSEGKTSEKFVCDSFGEGCSRCSPGASLVSHRLPRSSCLWSFELLLGRVEGSGGCDQAQPSMTHSTTAEVAVDSQHWLSPQYEISACLHALRMPWRVLWVGEVAHEEPSRKGKLISSPAAALEKAMAGLTPGVMRKFASDGWSKPRPSAAARIGASRPWTPLGGTRGPGPGWMDRVCAE